MLHGNIPVTLEIPELKKETGENIDFNIQNGNITVNGVEEEVIDNNENISNEIIENMVINQNKNIAEIQYKVEESKNGLVTLDNSETGNLVARFNSVSEEPVIWQSSNEEVATIDENGNITIHSNGTTEIIALVNGEEKDGITLETFSNVVMEESQNNVKMILIIGSMIVFLVIIIFIRRKYIK